MDYLQDLEVVEIWDCYSDQPSGEYYLNVKGVTSKQYLEQIKGLIELLRISHLTKENSK